jgi:DNA-binding GntR family transcriptional regulator
VPSSSAADRGYAFILGGILRGEFASGQPLRLRRLIEDSGVSQTPIREALARLEGQQLVERRPMSGYLVAAPLSDCDLASLMRARRILEPELAAEAARRWDGHGEHALSENVAATRLLPVDEGSAMLRYLELSSAFHETVSRAAADRFLGLALNALPVHVQRFRLFRGRADDVEVSLDEHERIATAIESGDVRGARTAMFDHIAGVARRSGVAGR